jgi:hypothetical protein
MEYVYSDQSQINVPGNEFRISTTTAPLWKTKNDHNKQDQILNSDSSVVVQDGLPIGTGNVRNHSFAVVEPYSVALLDINKLVFYNDYDPSLTPSASLPIAFTNPQAPVYDTIKLHLVQGFNFEDNKALILSVKARRKDGSTFILCNLVYNKQDVWETLNPSSFFFGGRIYNSYLEVRVLSLYNLIYDYWLGVLNTDTVAERITDQIGILRDQQIQVYFSFASTEQTTDGQTYLTLVNTKSIDLPTRDQFETIAATIQEATSGDYVEFYATYNGSIIENYILDLNSSGYDYVLLHDLILSEYVYDVSTSSYSWLKTDELQITQQNEYDKPNTYRPIIKNAGAIAFKIDYTVRMYNKNDNSQVWKNSSMISNSAAKYGRVLKSINLGSNPIQTKIYNQKITKDISINRITEPVINNVKYITSLSNNSNISITSEAINPIAGATSGTLATQQSTLQNGGTSNLQVFGNGLGRIHLPNSAVYLKFTLFQMTNGQNGRMNLSGLGDLFINFVSPEGEDIEFGEYPSQYTSKTGGEVVFRLAASEAKKILKLTDKTFRIFLQNESGDRTFLYSGKFFSTEEMNKLIETDKITSLEAQNVDLTDKVKQLTTVAANQSQQVANLVLQNSSLSSNMSALTSALAAGNDGITQEQRDKIEADQKQTITDLQTQVTTLNTEVKTLMDQLRSTMDQLSEANGLIQQTNEIFDDPNKQSTSAVQKSIGKAKAKFKSVPATNMNK